MTIFILRRIYQTVIVVIGAVVLIFLLMYLIPGDPARMLAGKGATEETLDNIRAKYHLDEPLWEQFTSYLGRLTQGDLGESLRFKRPVTDIIQESLWWSLRLAIAAEVLIIIFGILAGIISAVKRYSFVDVLITLASSVLVAFPIFWIATLLKLVFAEWLGWLPPSGAPPDDAGFWTYISHFIMPASALAAISIAYVARMARSSMLEVTRQDYMRTAYAKGLTNRRVIYKHGLKNGLIPVVTYIGIDFGTLIGGAVLTEYIFNWPGLGHKLYNAVIQRDQPVVLGIVLILVLVFVFINLMVDISYAIMDPRIRLGSKTEGV